MYDKAVQELKTLHPINFLGLCLILSAVILTCGLIITAGIIVGGLIGCAIAFIVGPALLKPAPPEPRVITSVSNRPKLGSVAKKARRL